MNILEKIIETKKEEVILLKKNYTAASFTDSEFFHKESLKLKRHKDKLSIIAEIKKASPSKGVIKKDFDYMGIAEVYQANNVDAISVLTDEKYFSGSINYLNEIAKTKRVPLLRKDFIIDEMQVLQSKANGADLILLISEVLSASQIKELTHAANEAGLDVLLEMHSVKQIGKVDFSLNKLIGINNRNLEDFSVSLETTKQVANLIPDDVMVVSESGILAKEHIEFIKTTKASCLLVGEFLMAAENIEKRIAELNEWRKYED